MVLVPVALRRFVFPWFVWWLVDEISIVVCLVKDLAVLFRMVMSWFVEVCILLRSYFCVFVLAVHVAVGRHVAATHRSHVDYFGFFN